MAALILLLRSELWIVLRRDAEVLEEEGVDVRRLLDVLRRAARAVAGVRVYADEDGAVAGLPLLQGRGVLERVRDRKSTRLNSSHSQMSYAVLCLKKKSITIPLSFSNLKLLRRITRTDNILPRNFTRRQ